MKLLKIIYLFGQKNKIDIIAYIFSLLFFIVGMLVSLNRFWQYEAFYYDFGIFDRAIWEVAHFKPPIIDHLVVGGKWIFADHFSPIIFLLSPLYWLTDRSEVILIAQACIVATSGIVLYLVAKAVIKDSLCALGILVSYFLFVGLQNAVITDFHELTLLTLPFTLCYLGVVKSNKWLYLISLILVLCVKESAFLVGAGISISVYFLKRDWRRLAIGTFLLSILWGFSVIKFVIPFFSGGIYQYADAFPLRPDQLLIRFFDEPLKRRTLFFSFSSFGFLPLLSPAFWFLLFQDFFARFIPNTPTRWDLGLHYSAQTACILAISSAYTCARLRKIIKKDIVMKGIAILLICNAFFLYRFVLHGPFGLAYNPAFYHHTKNFVFLETLIKKIPPQASIMTQNNLASHFTHQDVKILKANYGAMRPEYIVIDARDGQSPNDFFVTGDIHSIIVGLKANNRYKMIYTNGQQYIFRIVTKKS